MKREIIKCKENHFGKRILKRNEKKLFGHIPKGYDKWQLKEK